MAGQRLAGAGNLPGFWDAKAFRSTSALRTVNADIKCSLFTGLRCPLGKQAQLLLLDAVLFGASLRLTPLGLAQKFIPDEFFHLATGTVEAIVKGLGASLEIGDNKTWIAALIGMLNPGNHPALSFQLPAA